MSGRGALASSSPARARPIRKSAGRRAREWRSARQPAFGPALPHPGTPPPPSTQAQRDAGLRNQARPGVRTRAAIDLPSRANRRGCPVADQGRRTAAARWQHSAQRARPAAAMCPPRRKRPRAPAVRRVEPRPSMRRPAATDRFSMTKPRGTAASSGSNCCVVPTWLSRSAQRADERDFPPT